LLEQRDQDLVRGPPPAERETHADVERVGQSRRVVGVLGQVGEEAAHEPRTPPRPELQQELDVRPDPGHGGRERIVDVERSEDKDARSTAVLDPVCDHLSRAKESDRTEGGRDDGTRGAGEKLGSRAKVACGMPQLDGGLHRPRSGERLRDARTSGSTPAGAGVQS
jgi:hypothetical protein